MTDQEKIKRRIDSIRKTLSNLQQSFMEAEIAVKQFNEKLEELYGTVIAKNLQKELEELDSEAEELEIKRDKLSLRLEEEINEFKEKIGSDI